MNVLVDNYAEEGRNITCEDREDWGYNAPHKFRVSDDYGNIVGMVNFQCGPKKEAGINGVTEQDLLAMVLTRLNAFQGSVYCCTQNSIAIKAIETAMLALRDRTERRKLAGIEGTSEPLMNGKNADGVPDDRCIDSRSITPGYVSIDVLRTALDFKEPLVISEEQYNAIVKILEDIDAYEKGDDNTNSVPDDRCIDTGNTSFLGNHIPVIRASEKRHKLNLLLVRMKTILKK